MKKLALLGFCALCAGLVAIEATGAQVLVVDFTGNPLSRAEMAALSKIAAVCVDGRPGYRAVLPARDESVLPDDPRYAFVLSGVAEPSVGAIRLSLALERVADRTRSFVEVKDQSAERLALALPSAIDRLFDQIEDGGKSGSPASATPLSRAPSLAALAGYWRSVGNSPVAGLALYADGKALLLASDGSLVKAKAVLSPTSIAIEQTEPFSARFFRRTWGVPSPFADVFPGESSPWKWRLVPDATGTTLQGTLEFRKPYLDHAGIWRLSDIIVEEERFERLAKP